MKRRRDSSPSAVPGSDSGNADNFAGPSHSGVAKLRRAFSEPPDTQRTTEVGGALTCTLAPTCSGPNRATVVGSIQEMERHYSMYHAFMCSADGGCCCVFPDARFLALHQTECHDPLIAIRKERGEKTFECFLESCGRKFLTPKARRLHLISAHGYSKEFFFAITNKGIGGLVRKWGEGVSLIRGEWKERIDEMDDPGEVPHEATAQPSGPPFIRDPPPHFDKVQFVPMDTARPLRPARAETPPPRQGAMREPSSASTWQGQKDDDSLNSLTSKLDMLSLVPTSIRFGRGGKQRGFAPRGKAPVLIDTARESEMDTDTVQT